MLLDPDIEMPMQDGFTWNQTLLTDLRSSRRIGDGCLAL